MGNIKETQYFQAVQDKKVEVSDVLEQVYIALTEKGYNPVNQIVGYIWGSYLYYQPQGSQKPYYEGGKR